MRRIRDSQAGYTLLEMLLAMAVLAMVMAGVYAALRLGLSAEGRRQTQATQSARAALDSVSHQLQSAFCIMDSTSYPFNGSLSSVSFFVFPANEKTPLRMAYFKGDGKTCNGLCRTVNRDPFNPHAPPPEPVPVALDVESIEFSYFDGSEWLPAWNNPGILPKRVRISVDIVSGNATEQYATETSLPGSIWLTPDLASSHGI